MLSRPHRSDAARTLDLVGLISVTVALGCAQLDTVDGSRCGDGVLDPSTEECDRPDGDGCGIPGTPNACRVIVEGSDTCTSGRVLASDDERCLAPSGQFEHVAGVVGEYPVGVADFDADGRVDLLVEDGFDRRAVFFGDDGPLEPSVFLGPANSADWPIIDGNQDAFADVLVATSARDAIGMFLGAADRTFFPQFQASLPLPEGTLRLILLPPTPQEDPQIGTIPASSLRSLTQVAAISIDNDQIAVCRLFTGAPCQPITLSGITITKPETALITRPYFIDGDADATTAFERTPRFQITAADKGGTEAFRVNFPNNAGPSVTPVNFYAQAFANAGDECTPNICGGACPHPCEPMSNIGVEALQDLEDIDLGPVTVVAGSFGSISDRKLMLFIISARDSSATAIPLFSIEEAPSIGPGVEVVDVLLPNLNGEGRPELVVTTSNEFNGLGSRVQILEPMPATLSGPSGRLASGDVNGDGYDDLVGITSSSIDGVDTRGEILFGGPTVPFVTTTFEIAGERPSFTIADLDGDGVSDIVTSSRVQSEAAGGETSELEVSFGRAFSIPEPARSLGRADIQEVVSARLQLLTDKNDKNASADGVGDLVILKNKGGQGKEASFLVGDTKRLPSSPVYVRPRLKEALALTNEPILVGAILSLGTPDDALAPAEGSVPAVAVMNVLKLIEDPNPSDELDESTLESSVVQVSSKGGVLELDPALVSLGTNVLFGRPVVLGRDKTSVMFALPLFDVAAAANSPEATKLVLLRSNGTTLEQVGELFTPPLPGNFFLPGRAGKDGELASIFVLSSDVTTGGVLGDRLLELQVETDGLVANNDVPLGALLGATTTTGVLRLGPDALQVGETVLSLAATFEQGGPVEETCVAPFRSERTYFSTSIETDLVGDALPDIIFSEPLEIQKQAAALSCGFAE